MLMQNSCRFSSFLRKQLTVWIFCSVVRLELTPYLNTVTCLSSNTTRPLPLQVTAINSSTCAASSAPTSRWRQSNRTWRRDAPGSSNTPFPSHFPTQWVQHCFVCCWIWPLSSSTVYPYCLHQSAGKRNVANVQRKPQPRSAPAAKSPVISHSLGVPSWSRDTRTCAKCALWVI